MLHSHLVKTYIFEIVEVVPDPNIPPQRWYKLRLRCRDEAKGPVTAVCGFSGYVVSSMGQKVTHCSYLSDLADGSRSLYVLLILMNAL
jgi:cleavage and polyadenylation specificity factor subunit 1